MLSLSIFGEFVVVVTGALMLFPSSVFAAAGGGGLIGLSSPVIAGGEFAAFSDILVVD